MALITFEGIEGSGKSTQARRLAQSIGAVLTFEPGATELGRGIRGLLLDARGRVSAQAELLLFAADRAEHVAEVIAPALAEGRVVVSDRFADSTLAYQGYGRGLAPESIRELAAIATAGVTPRLTFLIDVPVAVGLARAGRRGAGDRIESEAVAFHERVRAGFLELAAMEPDRWVRLDGERDADALAREILDVVTALGMAKNAVR